MDRKTLYKLIGQISQQLNEKNPIASRQMQRLVERCGIEFAESILHQTLEIEANGGMLTLDGSRRRTPGGVFLYLARQQTPPELHQEIFIRSKKKKRVDAPTPQVANPQATKPQMAQSPALPPAAASKLKQLQLAADTLRQRVVDLKHKPEEQQYALAMAERLLANTEAQIQALYQQAADS